MPITLGVVNVFGLAEPVGRVGPFPVLAFYWDGPPEQPQFWPIFAEKISVGNLGFIAILLSLSTTLAGPVADTSLWLHQKFSNQTCGDLSVAEAKAITNCQVVPDTLATAKEVNEAAEDIFFHQMAKDHSKQLACEIANVKIFEKQDDLIRTRAKEISSKLPMIKELIESVRTKSQQLFQIRNTNNSLAGGCRNAAGSIRSQCLGDLERRKEDEVALENALKYHQGLLAATTGSLWQGSTETMQGLIKNLAQKNPIPSSDQVMIAFRQTIPKVKAELLGSQAHIDSQATKPEKS